MEQTAIESRVEAGAKWLDAKMPNWFTKIDVVRLKMESLCDCIVGQLANLGRDEYEAGSYTSFTGNDVRGKGIDCVEFGFDGVAGSDFLLLRDVWIKEINARLTAAKGQ